MREGALVAVRTACLSLSFGSCHRGNVTDPHVQCECRSSVRIVESETAEKRVVKTIWEFGSDVFKRHRRTTLIHHTILGLLHGDSLNGVLALTSHRCNSADQVLLGGTGRGAVEFWGELLAVDQSRQRAIDNAKRAVISACYEISVANLL